MIFDTNTCHFTLESGRVFYAYDGRLSLDECGQLAYGYDGCIEFDEPDEDEPHYGPPLTPDERREIAEFMIARWKAWI